MRIYDAATLASLNARQGTIAHRLIWISARETGTETIAALGLWSGEYDLAITIGGQARVYIGAGGVLQADPISAQAGLAVRIHQLRLAAVAPEVEDLVKGYDTRFAPVEIHRALFDPATRALVGDPHRVYLGMINNIEFPTAAPGGQAECIVSVASETRVLTRTLAGKKSDETHKARAADRFRRYGDISGSVPVYWGEGRAAAPADPKPKSPTASVQKTDDFGNIIYGEGGG